MEYISNSQFTDTEFQKWKVEVIESDAKIKPGWLIILSFLWTQMDKRGLKLPTVEFVQRKARKLEEVKNISLKEEDVEKVS